MGEVKKIKYIKVHHCYISKEFSIVDTILLEMVYFKSEDGYFFKSITYLEKVTKFRRPTIKEAFEKFKEMKLIHKINNNCYELTHEFDLFYNKRFREGSVPYNDGTLNMSTYNQISFKLMNELGLNIIQYCFIDTCIGLFLKKGNGTNGYIRKQYFMKIFSISDGYFYKVRRQLVKKEYIAKDISSKKYFIEAYIFEKFSKARDEKT